MTSINVEDIDEDMIKSYKPKRIRQPLYEQFILGPYNIRIPKNNTIRLIYETLNAKGSFCEEEKEEAESVPESQIKDFVDSHIVMDKNENLWWVEDMSSITLDISSINEDTIQMTVFIHSSVNDYFSFYLKKEPLTECEKDFFHRIDESKQFDSRLIEALLENIDSNSDKWCHFTSQKVMNKYLRMKNCDVYIATAWID